MRVLKHVLLAVFGMHALCPLARAYEVNEKLSIGGVAAGSVQCQQLAEKAGARNRCRSVFPFQPELGFRPTDRDEFFIKAGFSSGNGLNAASPFERSVWAASLEDDVKDINGRNRDYLLTAWYRHAFRFRQDRALGITLGIVDATDYLDENVYSNDEYTQFMNAALVNGPTAFLPSYDAGTALEWDSKRWSLRGVAMDIDENSDGNGFYFYGIQVGYRMDTALGEGNYRLVGQITSSDFLAPDEISRERRKGILVSLDQQFGHSLGGFVRLGWQADDAAVPYEALYSGGIDIRGNAWRRARDNIGLAYAWLEGGNKNIDRTHVVEGYYRFVFNDYLALSADLQYMKDDRRREDGPKGFIYGVRATVEF